MGREPEEGGNGINFYQMRYWSATELGEALDAFQELDTAGRDRAAAMIISNGRSYLSPALIAEALVHAAAGDPPDERTAQRWNEQVANTGTQWGSMNPAAAAEWVTGLPPGEMREWAGRGLVQSWARLSEPTGW